MSEAERLRQIARCDEEIRLMELQPVGPPAWLVTLGIEDWLAERRLLEAMKGEDRADPS